MATMQELSSLRYQHQQNFKARCQREEQEKARLWVGRELQRMFELDDLPNVTLVDGELAVFQVDGYHFHVKNDYGSYTLLIEVTCPTCGERWLTTMHESTLGESAAGTLVHPHCPAHQTPPDPTADAGTCPLNGKRSCNEQCPWWYNLPNKQGGCAVWVMAQCLRTLALREP